MLLAVQIVEILWTKATRGAPHSAERVALPRAFALHGPDGEVRVETVRLAEWEGFHPARIDHRAVGSPDFSVDCLHLRIRSQDAVEIAFLGTPSSGQPKRRPIQNLLRLGPDAYGRIIVNARHTSYSGQHYREAIYNIAFGAHITADRFVSAPPTDLRDLRADLF